MPHISIVPLLGHCASDLCESNGRPRNVFKGLLLQSNRTPSVIEINKESTMVLIEDA